jgi:hypothetical protein
MTNAELIAAATESGNIALALKIANSPAYIAEVEAQVVVFHSRPKTTIDTTAADYAAKRTGFDYEGAILARDERLLHSI